MTRWDEAAQVEHRLREFFELASLRCSHCGALTRHAEDAAADERSLAELGATELLASRLIRYQDQPGFQMATFAESYDEKAATAADARKALGANLALISALEQHDNRWRARLELREPARGRSLGTRVVDVPVTEPFAFADSLYHGALALLRLPAGAHTAESDFGVRGAGTLRFLMQGVGRRRAAPGADDRRRAIEDFETACRTELMADIRP